MSAISQRYKLFICCSIPEPNCKACLIVELSKSKNLEHIVTCTFNGFLKMDIII